MEEAEMVITPNIKQNMQIGGRWAGWCCGGSPSSALYVTKHGIDTRRDANLARQKAFEDSAMESGKSRVWHEREAVLASQPQAPGDAGEETLVS